MPWVKLFTEMLDDAKLLPLTEAVKWRFVQLILLAGDCDQGGWLANNVGPIPVETIAMRLRTTFDQLKKDLARLQAAGLMVFDRKSNAWKVTNFDKRQGRPQAQKRELWRDQKHRQRRVRADTGGTPSGVRPQHGNGVHLTEEELEEEKDLEGEEEGEPGAAAPHPEDTEPMGEFGESSTSPKQPADLPAAVRVYEANGGQYASGTLIDGTTKKEHARQYIAEHVRDTPESLELWGKVVFAYQVQWSAKSYTVMVNDYYARGRIPGQPTNGKAPASKYAALMRGLEEPERDNA